VLQSEPLPAEPRLLPWELAHLRTTQTFVGGFAGTAPISAHFCQTVSTPVLQPIAKRSGFGEIIDFNLNNEVTFEFLVPKSIKLLLLTLGHRGVFGPSHPRFAHFCLPSFRGHLGVVLTLVSGNCKVTRPPAVQMRQAHWTKGALPCHPLGWNGLRGHSNLQFVLLVQNLCRNIGVQAGPMMFSQPIEVSGGPSIQNFITDGTCPGATHGL
jgi:hypothetical protein